MKLNKSTILAAVTLAVLSVALATSAKAQILYDFQFTFTGENSQTGAAVLGLSTDPAWNSMGSYSGSNNYGQRGNNVALNTTTGATGATVSWGGHDFISTNYGTVNGGTNTGSNWGGAGGQSLADPGTENLYTYNEFSSNAGGQYVNIAGLADNQAYTLDLYTGGNGAPARPADFSVSGASTYSGFSSAGSYSISDGPGIAYAEISVVSSATGTLNITETSPIGGYYVLDGFQLQSVAAVPEPSSLSLIGGGIGALVLLARARRRITA